METDVRERERDLEQRQGNFDTWMKEQEQIIQQRYNIHCTCTCTCIYINVQQVWYTEHVHVYMYMYMQVGTCTCTLLSNKFKIGIQNMHVHSV